MQTRHHPLHPATPGTQRSLVSLHFGRPGSGPKAYIQASLHADEVPAMLAAHHLRPRLAALEAEGRIRGEIVLVPMANPIGMSQRMLHLSQGRFDLASGENFNRHYADLVDTVADTVADALGAELAANVALVRGALREACERLPADTELQSLRRTLLSLAADADTVLDLHCDNEALLHLYTATPHWPLVQPLAHALGASLTLLATHSGDNPFDEACSMFWPRLSEALAKRPGPARLARLLPLPDACVAVTVELRGESQVDHALAERDASALLDYLGWRGMIEGSPKRRVKAARVASGSLATAALPSALALGASRVPTPPNSSPLARPLAGSFPVVAPVGGVLVFIAAIGQELHAGDTVAEVIDPVSGHITALHAPVDGLLYARESRRLAVAGMRVAKVAGHVALRTGNLLSA
jgi:predicted deacylase